jgi:hypothetical protein
VSPGLSTFYLQISIFLSGAEGIRTPDLRRAKSDNYIPSRPTAPGGFACQRALRRLALLLFSFTYHPISIWLQYGCSKWPQYNVGVVRGLQDLPTKWDKKRESRGVDLNRLPLLITSCLSPS